jgi:hypothetical protein
MSAAAMTNPSLIPSAACNLDPATVHPTKHATTVAADATAKLNSNGPHRLQQSFKSAPNKINGVANCNVSSCNDVEAFVPPGHSTPTDANKKVQAMAVTGGPNSRPIRVVSPKTCATAAVPVKAAKFPHVSSEGINDDGDVDNCNNELED